MYYSYYNYRLQYQILLYSNIYGSVKLFIGVLMDLFKIAISIYDSFIDMNLELRVNLPKLLIYHKISRNHI